VGRLGAYLRATRPGQIADTTDLELLPAACRDELSGNLGGMQGYRLPGRKEDVTWEPPVLAFAVERHGSYSS
jgi:hypothetical protein